ncbi:hypothetical protein [Hoeflea olei]|uniref:C4-dicarboxylate ABC transporter substrate-binding protein n=1 Tax=Hoeflea olei TaxID=1480615 RepID=A0A1C1YVJ0_9HYPH|nr:hypothetical protein [Hoeflea olei]OCW57370.1 hypothetical protein AWJ14_18075 [Hoeflea olei]
MTLTGHYFWPGVIMLSGAAWEKLSDADKAAVEAAGKEATTEAYALAASQDAETVAFLKENGVTVNELSDLDALKALTAPVVETWKGKDPLIAKFDEAFAKGQ